jgi:serine/threonine protein phosphatase PrpC
MELFKSEFDVYGTSARHGQKKNGDSFLWLHIESERLLVLAVADGVGSHRCDWWASAKACRTTVDAFHHGSGTIADTLLRGVLNAHQEIRNASEQYAGAMTTIVAVVWEVGGNRIWHTSAGDSRLYRFTPGEFQLLTHDDRRPVLVRIAGEPVMDGGMPVFAGALTRALGQPSDLSVEVNVSPFETGESLLLATDGMHGGGFGAERLRNHLSQVDLETPLAELVRQCCSQFEDDATALVLRRNDLGGSIADYEDALAHSSDYASKGLVGHIMTAFLARQLAAAADHGDMAQVTAILDYSETFVLRLPRQILTEALGPIIKNGHKLIAQRLRTMIRSVR